MLYKVFNVVFALSIMGSVLTLMILLVKALFGSRLSARFHSLVWSLLILRLVIPFAPGHDLSIFNLFRPVVSITSGSAAGAEDTFSGAIPVILARAPESNPLTAIPSLQVSDAFHAAGTSFSLTGLIGVFWAAGALFLALVFIITNVVLSIRLRKSPLCHDASTLEVLDTCRKALGIKARIPLVIYANAGTPMLAGLIRPRIVVSHETLEKLSCKDMQHVFLHELMHLRRRDILTNWIIVVIRCVYWFNPVIWYACSRIRNDCEYACDEGVLRLLGKEEHKSYGQTILSLAQIRSKAFAVACTTGMTDKKSAIKRRIRMIAGFRKKTWAWTLLAVALTLLAGCSTMAAAELDLPVPPLTDQEIEDNSPGNAFGDDQMERLDGNPTPQPEKAEEAQEATTPPSQQEADSLLLVLQKDFSGTDVEKALQNGQIVIYDGESIRAMGITSLETLLELQDAGILEISQADMEELKNQPQDTGLLGYFTSKNSQQMKDLVNRTVTYYMKKLIDPSYTKTYGHGYIWYTAAEELGRMGKPAIPELIYRIGTPDDYERSLILYALLLASQQENVKAFTGGEYIDVSLDFNPSSHPAMAETAMDWWEKYIEYFPDR